MRFGLSFWMSNDDCGLLNEDFPIGVFSSIELSGEHFDSYEPWNYLDHSDVNKLYLRDPLYPGLTQGILAQPRHLVRQFTEEFIKILFRASECGVSAVTLDFSLEFNTNDTEFRNTLIRFLRDIQFHLWKNSVSLLFPIRLPTVALYDAEHYLSLLTDLMCPQLGLCVDIHPHEMKKDFSPKELLRWFHFDTRLFRFVYEPETGNYLTPKLVGPWLDYLREIAFDGEILFSPMCYSAETMRREKSSLSELVSAL